MSVLPTFTTSSPAGTYTTSQLTFAAISSLVFAALLLSAVNTALAACVKQEQIQLTAKGAAIGAFAGLLKSMAGDNSKKNDTGKNQG